MLTQNIIFIFILHICLVNSLHSSHVGDGKSDSSKDIHKTNATESKRHCNISFDVEKVFSSLNKLDVQYAAVRKKFHESMGGQKFDDEMTRLMIKQRGAADRTIYNANITMKPIPAGINLGGYSIMKMNHILLNELLFFYRMKLRNDTVFRLDNISSDFKDMVLKAHLTLNDLHLVGTYTSCRIINGSIHYIFCSPNTEEVEFLMKNVRYKLEGRYRLLRDRLKLEMIVSNIDMDEVLMTRMKKNDSLQTHGIDKDQLAEFISRLKTDLDKWMKDYFNDYLMYLTSKKDDKFQKYDEKKTQILNDYADKTIDVLTKRIREIGATCVKIPNYNFILLTGTGLFLKHGKICGLDSIYRRSTATGSGVRRNTRNISAVVDFSNLKVSYTYETISIHGITPVTGELILTADDLNALMSLSLKKLLKKNKSDDTNLIDIQFQFLENTKPESLTVEGPASRMLSNLKPLLENHVIAIMSNALTYNVNMLGSIAKCVSSIPPQPDNFEDCPENSSTQENDVVSENDLACENEVNNKTTNDLNEPENRFPGDGDSDDTDYDHNQIISNEKAGSKENNHSSEDKSEDSRNSASNDV